MNTPEKSLFENLEDEGVVPEYLKTALTSEIDIVRDVLQVIGVFGDSYLKAFTTVATLNNQPEEQQQEDTTN